MIDATNFKETLTIEKALLKVEIKTDNGTYKVESADNVILSGGNIIGAKTITVKAGDVTAENGVTVKTEGITSTNINGKDFNFEGNSEFVISENSARAINGNFKVNDSLNVDKPLTVKGDSDGVKVIVKDGAVTSITGLNSGGTVTYNGKTYQRNGDSITLNRITYDIDDTTNLLRIIPIDTYTKITDTIDLTNAKDGAIFAINDEYVVAYLKNENGKPILTKGPYIDDVSLKINAGNYSEVTADFAATVNTKGTATVNGITYNSTGGALTIQTSPTSSSLYNGTVNVIDSMNMLNVKNVVTKDDSDGVIVTFTDGNATSITGLSEGGSVSYNGTTFTRKNNLVLYRYMAYIVDDSTNILDLKNGNSYIQITDTIDFTKHTATTDMLFGAGDAVVAKSFVRNRKRYVEMYSDEAVKIKTAGTININGVDYVSTCALEFIFKDGEVTSIVGLADGGVVEFGGKTYERVGDNLFDGTQVFKFNENSNILELTDGSPYRVVDDVIDLTNISSDTVIFNKDKVQILKDGVLTIDGGNFKNSAVHVKLSPANPAAITVKNADGKVVKTYDNFKFADETTLTATFTDGKFNHLEWNGNGAIEDTEISTGDIKITGGNLHLYGGKVTAENIIVQSESASASFQINGSQNADEISIGKLTVSGGKNYAYIYGNAGNDLISAANISGNGILTIDGGLGDDTISIDDSTNIYVKMSDGSDTVIVGGAKILQSSTANDGKTYSFPTGKTPLKKIAESADLTQEILGLRGGYATVEADSADTVTIQENGKAYIISGDSTYFIESTKGDITFQLGKAQITDGWAGELSDGTPITLTDGTFTLNGTTYTYAEKVLSYVDSNGNKQAYTGNVENITAKDFVDDGTNYELKLNEIMCTDGVIKLEGVKENSYFADSNGNRLAKLENNYLTKVADGVTLIDTSNYGKAVTIDYSFKNIPIKTVDGTFTVSGIVLVEGQTESITVDAEGKVSGTTGLFRYTLTSGGIKIESGAAVSLNGEGTVNGAKFKTTTNSTITATANSAYAYIGIFIVTDSLNYSSSDVMTVENDSDGIIYTRENFNNAITGLNDGGTVTYGGKTYQRVGNKLYLDGKAYDCEDTTNLLQLKNGVDYLEITDSIDISKLSEGMLIVDADKNVVAEYDGTTLKVTGDVELKSITNLKDGGTVEYGGKTYQRVGNKLYLDGAVYDFTDDTNILELGGGESYYEVTDSIDISQLAEGMLIVDANKNIVATYDGKTLKVTGDVELTSIVGLSDGGTVEYKGVTYTRNGDKLYIEGAVYDFTDDTNILEVGGELYTEVVNNIIDLTNINGEMVFGIKDVKVAEYSGGVLTIESGNFIVKTFGNVTIGSTTYNSNGELEISADKNSSSVLNGTVNVAENQFGVKIRDDSDGVAVTFANKNITSITGLNDGGTLTYGSKTYNRTNDKIFKDGKVYKVDDSTNILSPGNGATYVEVKDTIDISKLSAGAFIVDANKNIVATYEEKTLNVTGDITLKSITNLQDGGKVEYKGVTYSRNGNRITDGTKTFIGDTTANLLDLEKLPEVVNIDGTLNLTGIKDGSIITRNGVEIIKVGKNANGYKLTKLNNAANGITIDAGNIGTVNLDFDATITTLGSVTVNGTNYKTVSGVNVSVKDDKVSLLDGYISMDKTLQTADGKIYTKSSGSANVLVESGTLTSIKNFVGKIEGDFTNSINVNGNALYVAVDNDITIEAKNTNGLYEIGGLSQGMRILKDGKAERFTTDSGGEFTIGGKLCKLSSNGTLDRNGNIFNFKGSISSFHSTYTINGKKVSASRARLTFVTDGYKITEIRGLKKGDWVSGDIDGAQFTLPNGSVTFNGTTYTVKSDFDGVIVKGDTISSLDAGAELSIDKAGYYQVNGTYFTLKANQPIYGVFNPNDLRLTATENQKTADLFNANTPIKPGDIATFIKIDEGTSIFDIKPVDIKINPNESAAVTSGQELQVEVWNGQAFTIYSPPDGSNAMIWQNGNGTTETGGTTNVSNYDPSNGSGIQTNQDNRDDLLNQFIDGVYSASSDAGDGLDMAKILEQSKIQHQITFTFTNSADGKTNFNGPVLFHMSDLAEDIAKVNVENGMLVNFYTFDGKANQFAWTGNRGGNIDGSNAKTDLIMQGNFNGTNNGGSNLFGGKGDNAFLAGSGDNVYLGTGKNDVYLNKNREDKIGVGIYAYDNLIGDSSSGNSSDLAENIDGQSADSTGEKNYSSVVNNFKFGFDYDSDILYISGYSSSRDIKQNFIEPLKEMFESLVDEINDAENDSTVESSADLAESALIINRPIFATNRNSLNTSSTLRQSNRQVDIISQAVIGVNTNALSAKLNELQNKLNNLRKLTPTSTKDLTNNTSSTPNLTIEKMQQQAQQIKENSTSVQDNSNNATPIIPDVLDILSGNGDTKANINLPQINTTSDLTQNNPAFQQAFQQLQQQAQQMQEITNNLEDEEKNKQKMQNNPELQEYRQQVEQWREVVENAPIISLDTPLFAGDSSTSNNTSTTDNTTPSTTDNSTDNTTTQNDSSQLILIDQKDNPTPLTTDNPTPSTLDDLKSKFILIDPKDNPTPQNDSLQLTLIDPKDNTTPQNDSSQVTLIDPDTDKEIELKTVNNSGEVKFNDNSGNVVQIQDDSTKNDDLKSKITLIDPKDKEIVQPYSEVDVSLEFLERMQNVPPITPPITFGSFKRDDGGIDFKNVQLKDNSDTKSSGDAADGSALGNVDYTKLIVGYEDGTVKTAIAGKGAVINLDWNGDERAEEYIGDNSGVDVGEYDGTVAINLNTGVGVLDGDEAIIIGGVDKLKAGSGAAMFVGSADAPNTLMGGSGDSSIWGGGDTKDLLVGYSGEDKSGSTNFFYVKGDGKDTISGFAYLTSENADTADEINFLENSVTKIHIDGKDVYLTVENDDDVLKVEGAVGKDFKVRNNNTAVIAQVGTDKLTYDGRANYFYAAGKNATVKVDGSVQTAEIWLNGAKGEYYTGDIKVLDAAQVEGRTTLVGNDYDNVIIAGNGDSSMWGGNSSSNDTLIGGEGSDNFFYTYGNGKDTINNAADNDTVNLFNMNLEQISGVEVNTSAVKINFTDGGSLTINGNTSGLTYKVGGENYIVNQSTRNWTKK